MRKSLAFYQDYASEEEKQLYLEAKEILDSRREDRRRLWVDKARELDLR